MRVIRWAPLCSRPQLYHAASLPNVFFYDICFVVGLFVGLLVDVRLGRILFFSRSIRRFLYFVPQSRFLFFFFVLFVDEDAVYVSWDSMLGDGTPGDI